MKLEDMTIDEILEKCDFPESFLASFREWCSQQKPQGLMSGAALGVYNHPVGTPIIYTGNVGEEE